MIEIKVPKVSKMRRKGTRAAREGVRRRGWREGEAIKTEEEEKQKKRD